jgi:hypothetical protein
LYQFYRPQLSPFRPPSKLGDHHLSAVRDCLFSMFCIWRPSIPHNEFGIALGYRDRFLAGAGNFSLHHRVQNGAGTHPASCPLGTGGSFPGIKRPGREADHSPPSSATVKECVELYLHSPNSPSWRGA